MNPLARDATASPGALSVAGRSRPTRVDAGPERDAAGRHLLLVTPAGSYRTSQYLTAAHALGCVVTVVTDAAIAIPGTAIVTDLTDPAHAATVVVASLPSGVGRPDGVVGTDGAALAVAAEIARRLDLPGNPPAAVGIAENKLAQRRALARDRVPQPDFTVVHPPTAATDRSGDDVDALLPAVVKPVDRTAGQGVLLASTTAELRAAMARVRRMVGPVAPILVERFVPGVEVAVDALLTDGRMRVVAMFDKPDAPAGPTFPETLLISPARLDSDTAAAVVDVVARAARAVGLTDGPLHAECKVDSGRIWFLELAARTIGGLCSRAVRIGGRCLDEVVVCQALGLPPPPGDATGATGVLMLPVPAPGRLVGVTGVDRARGVEGVTDATVTVGAGELVRPLPDGDRYLGFVFASAATADGCERALRAAWSHLDVEIVADDHRFVGG